MKTGDIVTTPLGLGKIFSKESEYKYCIKLESCPDNLVGVQTIKGGVFFWKSEITKLEEKS
ncbi:MAG: hypothetical protein PF693_14370 [Spirochaetia bacterium]|nr:hypothetical protein [Spirochaetia bacterium]